jgi:hypothetical protein
MQLNQQLQILAQESPQHGVPAVVIERAFFPVLHHLASQLQHLEYYIPQTPQGDWLSTTIQHRQQPQQQKTVVYAFSNIGDAVNFEPSNPDLKPQPIWVTHLLFQLFGLKTVDSIIFYDLAGNTNTGKEITRAQLQILIQAQLQQLKKSSIPPNLA